jgi:hypothetical protein
MAGDIRVSRSTSLARRRSRSSQAKLSSIIQCCGRTSKPCRFAGQGRSRAVAEAAMALRYCRLVSGPATLATVRGYG